MMSFLRNLFVSLGSGGSVKDSIIGDDESMTLEEEREMRIRASIVHKEDESSPYEEIQGLSAMNLAWFSGVESKTIIRGFQDEHLSDDEKERINCCTKHLKKAFGKKNVSESTLKILSQNRVLTDRFSYLYFNPSLFEIPTQWKGLRPYLKVKLIFKQVRGAPFGTFHSCLLIGCWLIEWDSSSLLTIQQLDTTRLHFSIDLERYSTEDKIQESLNTIAMECCLWNGTNEYNAKECNGQHFVKAILGKIGIDVESNLKGICKNYFTTLLKEGTSTMKIDLTEELKTSLKLNQSTVTFKNHRQLDTFANNIAKECPYYFTQTMCDEMLLKSFDEAFWMSRESKSANKDRDEPLRNSGDKSCMCYFNINEASYDDYVNKGKAVNNLFCSEGLNPPFPLRL